VQGTTTNARTKVTLDGKYSVTSKLDKTFAFALLYLPTDCTIALTTTAGTDQALVSECGPKGANFIGPWKDRLK